MKYLTVAPQLSLGVAAGKVTTAPPGLVVETDWFPGQLIDGAVLSTTVTVVLHELAFPFTSVTVSVTGLDPTSAQVNVFGDTLVVAMPQASLEPAAIAFTSATDSV